MNYLTLFFAVLSTLLLFINASEFEETKNFSDTLRESHTAFFRHQAVISLLVTLLEDAQEKFTAGNEISDVKILFTNRINDKIRVRITNGIVKPTEADPIYSLNTKNGVMSYKNEYKTFISPPNDYFRIYIMIAETVEEWKTTIFSQKSIVLAKFESEGEKLTDDVLNKKFIEIMEGYTGISRVESKAGVVKFAKVFNEGAYDFEVMIKNFSVQNETIGNITITAFLKG